MVKAIDDTEKSDWGNLEKLVERSPSTEKVQEWSRSPANFFSFEEGYHTHLFSIGLEGAEKPLQIEGRIPPIRGRKSIDPEVESHDIKDNPYLRAAKLESEEFNRLLPELLRTLPGWFVAIHQQCRVDQDRDELELVRRVRQKYPGEFVLVRCVKPRAKHAIWLESPESTA